MSSSTTTTNNNNNTSSSSSSTTPANFTTIPRELRHNILTTAFKAAILLDITRPRSLVDVLDEIVAGRLPGKGFVGAHVTNLVSVVWELGGRLEEDMDFVVKGNAMWAYGEMKEEDARQVRERVRGGYCAIRVVG